MNQPLITQPFLSAPWMAPPVLSNEEYFKWWRTCAMCGPLFLTAFLIGWGALGSNIPPIPADHTADQMAAFFRSDYNLIRAGMSIAMLFACFYVVWTISITRVMRHINPKKNDIWPTLQMWGGGLTFVPLMVSSVFWLTGAYRPDQLSPVTLQMLYDQGWLLIDMAYFITTIPMVAIGVAGLTDERAKPLFPRWACWYSIWAGLSFLFELLMPFFKTGLFARQGWLNFWVEFLVWFVYIMVVTYFVMKAIPRLEKEREAALNQYSARAAD